jgi:hypothetical protein
MDYPPRKLPLKISFYNGSVYLINSDSFCIYGNYWLTLHLSSSHMPLFKVWTEDLTPAEEIYIPLYSFEK